MSRRVGLRHIQSIGAKAKVKAPSIWITYNLNDMVSNRVFVIKGSVHNGVWETDPGFPYFLGYGLASSVIPLTSGKVLCIYPAGGGVPVRMRTWNGIEWLPEVTTTSNVYDSSFVSAVAEGDNVHIVFSKDTNLDIIYVKYIYSSNSLSDEILIQPGPAEYYSTPVICRDIGTGNLYVFWGSNPTPDHIFYKRCVGGIWDPSPTDWIDETAEQLATSGYKDGRLTCFYESYGGYIGLAYMTKPFAPYNVKFVRLGGTPSTLGTTNSHWATNLYCQRKTFYAAGLFWVFYSNGTNMVYQTSADGVTWSSPIVVRPCASGEMFSVWFDGNFLHYAYGSAEYGVPLYYRIGKPKSDGTITWQIPEQEVVAGNPNVYYFYPFISVS